MLPQFVWLCGRARMVLQALWEFPIPGTENILSMALFTKEDDSVHVIVLLKKIVYAVSKLPILVVNIFLLIPTGLCRFALIDKR